MRHSLPDAVSFGGPGETPFELQRIGGKLSDTETEEELPLVAVVREVGQRLFPLLPCLKDTPWIE